MDLDIIFTGGSPDQEWSTGSMIYPYIVALPNLAGYALTPKSTCRMILYG